MRRKETQLLAMAVSSKVKHIVTAKPDASVSTTVHNDHDYCMETNESSNPSTINSQQQENVEGQKELSEKTMSSKVELLTTSPDAPVPTAAYNDHDYCMETNESSNPSTINSQQQENMEGQKQLSEKMVYSKVGLLTSSAVPVSTAAYNDHDYCIETNELSDSSTINAQQREKIERQKQRAKKFSKLKPITTSLHVGAPVPTAACNDYNYCIEIHEFCDPLTINAQQREKIERQKQRAEKTAFSKLKPITTSLGAPVPTAACNDYNYCIEIHEFSEHSTINSEQQENVEGQKQLCARTVSANVEPTTTTPDASLLTVVQNDHNYCMETKDLSDPSAINAHEQENVERQMKLSASTMSSKFEPTKWITTAPKAPLQTVPHTPQNNEHGYFMNVKRNEKGKRKKPLSDVSAKMKPVAAAPVAKVSNVAQTCERTTFMGTSGPVTCTISAHQEKQGCFQLSPIPITQQSPVLVYPVGVVSTLVLPPFQLPQKPVNACSAETVSGKALPINKTTPIAPVPTVAQSSDNEEHIGITGTSEFSEPGTNTNQLHEQVKVESQDQLPVKVEPLTTTSDAPVSTVVRVHNDHKYFIETNDFPDPSKYTTNSQELEKMESQEQLSVSVKEEPIPVTSDAPMSTAVHNGHKYFMEITDFTDSSTINTQGQEKIEGQEQLSVFAKVEPINVTPDAPVSTVVHNDHKYFIETNDFPDPSTINVQQQENVESQEQLSLKTVSAKVELITVTPDSPALAAVHNDHNYFMEREKQLSAEALSVSTKAEPIISTKAPLPTEAQSLNETRLHRRTQPRAACKPYQLSRCNEKFAEKRKLKLHRRTGTLEKRYLCHFCGNAMLCEWHLIHHLRTHTGEKPYKCTYCQKRFSQKSSLKLHVRTHTGEKPFQCSFCQKKFAQKITLSLHLRTHTGEKPYQCSYCEKSFAQKLSHTLHVRTHTGEKPYQCSHCDKSFASKISHTLHVRTHTGEKPYQCSYCDMRFLLKSYLTIHIRSHTGERPFECSYCQKKFFSKATRRIHLKTHCDKKCSN